MNRSKKKNWNKRGNQRGNQNKCTDSASPSAEEVVEPEPEPEPVHGSEPEQNGNAEVQSFGASESDVELERRKNGEEKCLQEKVRLLEDEKITWMQKEIGQGTYSNVYKARDRDTGKIVALKKVHFGTSESESVRFMAREIMILQKLDHPNVIKLEGLATSRMQFSLYLVFEFM